LFLPLFGGMTDIIKNFDHPACPLLGQAFFVCDRAEVISWAVFPAVRPHIDSLTPDGIVIS